MENVQEEKTIKENENENSNQTQNDKIDILLKENEFLKEQNKQIMQDLNMFKKALLSQTDVKSETEKRANDILNTLKKLR